MSETMIRMADRIVVKKVNHVGATFEHNKIELKNYYQTQKN